MAMQDRSAAAECMPGAHKVMPPQGWKDLVKRMPGMLRRGVPPAAVELDGTRRRQLETIHAAVNREVIWATDSFIHHKPDHWALPKAVKSWTYGDCEDHALERRRRLVEQEGWPFEALRLTLCALPRGQTVQTGRGHMVLTAEVTEAGARRTLVLDNLEPEVRDWRDYRWDLYRSDLGDAGAWICREVPGRFWWERIQATDAFV